VVPPVFQSAGYPFVLLPLLNSREELEIGRAAVTQRRGFNHIA
jgi:hypothetical protein